MPVALLLPAIQLLHPMPGVITQGVRANHPAIDIACTPGTPVRAAHDGNGRSERSYTHGITFVLQGADGLQTSYSHLQSAAPRGTYRRGAVIGHCGNTGSWSSGPHLHFASNRPNLLGSLLRDDNPALAVSSSSPAMAAQPPTARPIGGSPTALKALP